MPKKYRKPNSRVIVANKSTKKKKQPKQDLKSKKRNDEDSETDSKDDVEFFQSRCGFSFELLEEENE